MSLDIAEVDLRLEHEVISVELIGTGFEVKVIDNIGESLFFKSRKLVVGTGVDYKEPAECIGQSFDDVLIGAGARLNHYDFKNKRVAVLGGGDNALENALFAQKRGAAEVTVFARTLRGQANG